MQCPKCGFEPRDRLLSRPCPECSHEWWDTEDYTRMIAAGTGVPINSVLDIGCGNKGVIAEAYWIERAVPHIYMCDRHVLKQNPRYERLLMDAEDLVKKLGRDGIDFVTHCGFLEHVDYDKALRCLHVVEQLSRLGNFSTASCFMREVDFKVKQDGNPYHYYRSFWCPATMEALGYTVDRERMSTGKTFSQEVTWWWYKAQLTEPWSVRESRAIEVLCSRRCREPGCELEPVIYLPGTDNYSCLLHHGWETTPPNDGAGQRNIFDRWLTRPSAEEEFGRPPWREPRRVTP